MAYRLMKVVIASGKKTKEEMLTMCDVYYGADRLTEEQYTELVNLINA